LTRARPRIFVIDDDPGVCDLLVDLGERAGYDVDVAHSEAGALPLLDVPHRVAFVDRHIGADDGLAAVRTVAERDPEAVVAMMSGGADLVDEVDVRVVARLHKPFDVSVVRRLLDGLATPPSA
jgi:DNA-binding NtrC family response regulator